MFASRSLFAVQEAVNFCLCNVSTVGGGFDLSAFNPSRQRSIMNPEVFGGFIDREKLIGVFVELVAPLQNLLDHPFQLIVGGEDVRKRHG